MTNGSGCARLTCRVIFAKDSLRHLTSKIEQAGTVAAQTTSYGYDANGQPTTTTTPDGKTTTSTYDGLGRVIAIQNPDDTTVQATFDAASHTLTSSGASGTTSYAYDPLGRLSSETQKNPSGALLSTTSYAYDPNGNPSSMQVLNSGSAVYEADFTYDGGNRQTTVTDRVGPNRTQLDQYLTTYDQKNNPTEVDTNGTATTYKYNAASELVEVDDGSGSNATPTAKYTYDANHNRVSQWTTAGTTSYQYDSALTELTQQTDPGGKVTQYTYDLNGNLVKAIYDPTGANQTTTYSYDANQRLQEMDKPDGSKVVFTYDSNGNRIAKTVTTGGASPTTTQIKDIYQGGRIAYETDGVNTILATFAYDASGQPTSVQVGSDPSTAPRYYYVYNSHGDVVALVDSSGTSVAAYNYDAFGAVQFDTDNFSNGWHNPYLYVGAGRVRYDAETGLYWMSVRAYDPTLGRFISRDPLGRVPLIGLATQSYVYADNNPLKNIDPSGQLFWPWERTRHPMGLGALAASVFARIRLVQPISVSGGANLLQAPYQGPCAGSMQCVIELGGVDVGLGRQAHATDPTTSVWYKWTHQLEDRFSIGAGSFIGWDADDAHNGANWLNALLNRMAGYPGRVSVVAHSNGAAALFTYLAGAQVGDYGGGAAISSFVAMDAPSGMLTVGAILAEFFWSGWNQAVTDVPASQYVSSHGIQGTYAWDIWDAVSFAVYGSWRELSINPGLENPVDNHLYLVNNPSGLPNLL